MPLHDQFSAALAAQLAGRNGDDDIEGEPRDFTIEELDALMAGRTDDGEVGEAEPSRAEVIRNRLLTPAELSNIPPPEPLVDGWLMRDTLAVLYGPSGAGKTFVALDIAAHVASTRRWWHGNETVTGTVLYVAAEGARGIAQRAEAWSAHHGVEPSGLRLLPVAVDIFDPGWADALAEVAAEMRPELIVIDTLARSIVGADENSARDIGVVVANVDRIRRESGACILLVHHSGKDAANGARGSSALRAAVDTELELTGDAVAQVLRCAKQKDSAEPERLTFARTFVPGTESCVVEARAHLAGHVAGPDIEAAVLAAIAAEQPVATRALRPLVRDQGVSTSNSTIADTVALLVHRGEVTEVPGPRNARLFSIANGRTP